MFDNTMTFCKIISGTVGLVVRPGLWYGLGTLLFRDSLRLMRSMAELRARACIKQGFVLNERRRNDSILRNRHCTYNSLIFGG